MLEVDGRGSGPTAGGLASPFTVTQYARSVVGSNEQQVAMARVFGGMGRVVLGASVGSLEFHGGSPEP